MICQNAQIINIHDDVNWEIPLQDLYQRFVKAVRLRRMRPYLPCIQRICKADDYILWGTYVRKNILDIQIVQDDEGKRSYQEIELFELHIQRIRVRNSGSTHAILMELFVPYGLFSLRYILFHLQQYGASKGCIERFWLSTVMSVLPDLILDHVQTLEGVQQVVDNYVERYNNSLNRGVNGVPNERYQASILLKPVRKPKSLEWLKEQFVNQKWCHIYNDNVIHLHSAHYRIPDELVSEVRRVFRKKIPVRYDPGHINETIHTNRCLDKLEFSSQKPLHQHELL